jgi:hypothetical protein
LFRSALEAAEQHEPYRAAWLVAEVGPALGRAGVADAWDLVVHYSKRARELGYGALDRHYASVLEARARERDADS